MIAFKDVSKKFPDGTVAVSDLNLEIADGEFVFLVGPSGSGKTTVLRMILRDILPSKGEIRVDDRLVNKLSSGQVTQLRRKIGIVFQDLRLLPDRNVFENVALSLWVLGKNKQEIEKEVMEKLAMVGMARQRDFFPIQLAGGELQRVAVARALAGDPKYLLADEPTGNVDDANAWKIVKILDKINSSGTTVVMATHNREIVDTLDKRVVRIEEGKIISDKKGKYR